MITIQNVECKVIAHSEEAKRTVFNMTCVVVADGDRNSRPIEDLEDFKKYIENYDRACLTKEVPQINVKTTYTKRKKQSMADMFKSEELLLVEKNTEASHKNPITDLEL
jgi:predicted metal-binding protein